MKKDLLSSARLLAMYDASNFKKKGNSYDDFIAKRNEIFADDLDIKVTPSENDFEMECELHTSFNRVMGGHDCYHITWLGVNACGEPKVNDLISVDLITAFAWFNGGELVESTSGSSYGRDDVCCSVTYKYDKPITMQTLIDYGYNGHKMDHLSMGNTEILVDIV